jgi:single-strand DNA-binding protein
MGRLVADPELKTTGDCKDFTKFKIAVNRYTKNKEHPEADFVPIVAFGKTATTVCNYFHKGDPIIIEGSLRINSYKDNEGNKRSLHRGHSKTNRVCAKIQTKRRKHLNG